MKDYPAIPQSIGTEFREIPNAYVFDKLDGSNLRFEWSSKTGWYKFGTRTRLFDENDWQFGRAIPLFHQTLGDPIAKIATDQRWGRVIVFAESYGPKSFAGRHHDSDNLPLDADGDMKLELIDVNPYKRGILGPAEYLKLFGNKVPMAAFLGRHNWTRGFVERVWNQEIPGITFEGVVGKSGDGKNHDLVMAKAKTKAWIDKVKSLYTVEDAEKIIKS